MLFFSIILLALRRLAAQPGPALCALTALILAIGIAASIPLYAEAASLRVLQEELARREAQQGRSPFALLIRYVDSQNQNRALPWETVIPADTFLREDGFTHLGLPHEAVVRHVRSAPVRLIPPDGTPTGKAVTLGVLNGLDSRITLIDGAPPQPATATDQPAQTLVSRALAEHAGLNVGDTIGALAVVRGRPFVIPLEISGIWAVAGDAADPAWPLHAAAFDDVLLLPEATYSGPIAAALETPVAQALWFVQLDPADLTPAQALTLRAQVERLRAALTTLLPGVRIEQGPAEALVTYQRAAAVLSGQLAVIAAPTLALVLAFVLLMAGLLTQRRAGEIALLSSRGVRDGALLGIVAVEWLLLCLIALAVGPLLGVSIARIIASTSSFLKIDPTLPPLTVQLSRTTLLTAGGVAALALLAVLAPTLLATRQTLADAQRARSRSPRPPFWQRSFADLVLLGVGLYGLRLLWSENDLLGGRDPITNPLLLLVPTLLCLSGGLLLLRGILPFWAWAARHAARRNGLTPVVVLRALAREAPEYRGSLVLIMLTLSLAIVSAALAATADAALQGGVAYQIGAQTQLIETGESTEAPQPGAGPERHDISQEPRFLFIPVSERLTVPGIQAASRVGTYNAAIRIGGATIDAQLIGIDRLTFPHVVPHFDPAWAGGASLGELMNLLARHPDGVLVSRAALAQGVQIGDRLPVEAELFGDRRTLTLRVVGALDLWPGVYPQNGPILVLNLNALFDQMGGQYPFDVWIARDPRIPLSAIERDVRRLGVALIAVRDVAEATRREQARPQRQGLFGMLSVGFAAAAGLSSMSFILNALITARRRMIELGVLRAMGLSNTRVRGIIALEQAAMIGVGLSGGVAIGLLTVLLVVPALQIGVGPWPGTPPVAVQQPWLAIILLTGLTALAFSMALGMLLLLQSRLRLLEAIKLGGGG